MKNRYHILTMLSILFFFYHEINAQTTVYDYSYNSAGELTTRTTAQNKQFVEDTKELEKDHKTFSFYPNPVIDFFSIELPDANQQAVFTLYDASARRVLSKPFTESTEVNISNLNSGIYFLEIRSKNQLWVKELIKQ